MAEDVAVPKPADTPRGLAHRQSNLNAHRRLLPQAESSMQRLRLKADGRIVELRDGREFPLQFRGPQIPAADAVAAPVTTNAAPPEMARSRLAPDPWRSWSKSLVVSSARLGVPVETIRN